MKFLSPEVAPYLYKFTIQTCIEYCCHVWAGTRICYLEMLELLFETLDLSWECCKLKSDGHLN